MATVSKIVEIGILGFSLAFGFLSFYVLADLSKEQRKSQMAELTSQFVNFVIFIWLGKVLFHISTFVSDPMSILAYPSDSRSFYFAVALIALVLVYRSRRNNLNVLPLLKSFALIFLISSFVYEFIQIVADNNKFAFGYFILLAILIGIFFILRERLSVISLLMIMVTAWSIGMFILAYAQPYVTVFGYMMAPWFIAVFFIVSISIFVYRSRRRDA